ncbi:uncharacterized protein LOC141702610 [Apium graveolens]|uniref:uncharacterized protein LOC141702610 n=1 Tax=Apium graveolens TaxID=4045 RepID=UPI003D79B9AC
MTCPCDDCFNLKKLPSATVREHLFRRGFMDGYTKWIWHGEGIHSKGTKTFDGYYESNRDNMRNNKEDDVGTDRVEEMIEDIEDILSHQPEILDNLVNGSKKLLYPGCSDQFSSDKSFTELLKLLRDILSPDNELPTSTYEAKKLLCPMGMTVEKIHACPNDCVLFRNENELLDTCPNCGASRYKRLENNSSANDKKRPPIKVFRYLPIVEQFIRLFANVHDVKLMRWYVEGRKVDGMLRHPVDSPQWRTIDGKFPEFGGEVRNL